MIYNKFINCQNLNTFNASLKSGDIVDQHIVFIEDVKQIWTNGVFYAANEFSQEDLAMLTKLADVLVMDGDGTKVLTNNGTYIDIPSFSEEESSKLVEISKILVTNGDGTKALMNNGTYVTMPQLNTSDVTSIKNLLSIIKTDGSGNKVLADNGTYIDNSSIGNVTAGSATQPVWVNNGTVTPCTYTLGKSVPADAKFTDTDTTYSAGSGLSMGNGNVINHVNSISAGTVGTSSATNGSTVAVPYVTYNATGHITAVGTHNHTVSGFAPEEHTHSYAGSSTAGGSATSAVKLDSSAGDGTTPVYFSGGKPVACTAYSSASVNHANTAGYVTRSRGCNKVSTLASLPITKDTIVATLTGATSISLNGNLNVGESLTVICTPSASFTQPLPTSGSYISMDGDSLKVTSGKKFEMNIYCYDTNLYSISCKTML